MRHLLSLTDTTTDEIRRILELSAEYKAKIKAGERPPVLERQVMGLLFEKPSLRTRVSFETLMNQVGGSSLFLGTDVGFGTREPLCDFMPILTRYVDVLVIRAKSHAMVEEAVSFSCCPVINGLTDVSHPVQALADVLTMQEHANQSLDQTKLCYVGDANNVTYSLAIACAKLGITMSIAAPAGYQFDSAFIDGLNKEAGSDLISQTDDLMTAVGDANFIYTDVWTSMGQEAESQQRLIDLADYQVNADVMKAAADDVKFMHCLPARRGEEVTAEVIDSPASVIIDEAENRLHAQKGLVIWLMKEAGLI